MIKFVRWTYTDNQVASDEKLETTCRYIRQVHCLRLSVANFWYNHLAS
jgi:hypothetical protein